MKISHYFVCAALSVMSLSAFADNVTCPEPSALISNGKFVQPTNWRYDFDPRSQYTPAKNPESTLIKAAFEPIVPGHPTMGGSPVCYYSFMTTAGGKALPLTLFWSSANVTFFDLPNPIPAIWKIDSDQFYDCGPATGGTVSTCYFIPEHNQ